MAKLGTVEVPVKVTGMTEELERLGWGIIEAHGKKPGAMISRIRVEARGESMDAAQQVIEMFLAHARTAGYLEGIVPQSSETTDDHYGEVRQSDGWTDLGLPFEGRVVCRFDPERTKGGLRQHGFEVRVTDDSMFIHSAPDEPERSVEEGGDVTGRVLVLERRVPVTREHSWDDTVSALVPEMDVDALRDDLNSIREVKGIDFGVNPEEGHVTVRVTLDGWEPVRTGAPRLRDALEDAHRQVLQRIRGLALDPRGDRH